MTLSRRCSKAFIVLCGICVFDAVATAMLVSMGLATEANPFMASCISHGLPTFFTVKLGMLVPLAFLVEWYRRRNPVFVEYAMRTAVIGYLSIYVVASIAVNTAL